jgi:hypothetical protein
MRQQHGKLLLLFFVPLDSSKIDRIGVSAENE